uniref:Aryl hydrocarbon receptor nuclear translocator-like protein 1 isoform X2 n=1 Tax=Crassostrea virginica TaxID=6565 RepID=A0A8B8D3H0_CRAVI|nr:aryl hydrocarbon receptor nuclear translocator-like protein 1 isoform X2 [Crassostrea virginica]
MDTNSDSPECSLKRKDSVSDEEKFIANKRKLRREGEKLRRERLNRTLSLLAEEVPWLKECERRPDKSSILKLTVNYLKLNIGIKKKSLNFVLPKFLKDTVSEELLGSVACGSLLIVSESGTILYMSESLTHQLGWLQIDVVGSLINKMIHKDDVEVLKLQFNRHSNFHYTTQSCEEDNKAYIPVNSSRKVYRSFFVRMQNLHQTTGHVPHYDAMQIVGHLHFHTQDRKKARSVLNENWLVGVCRPVSHQNWINMQAYEDNSNPEWISQHAMDGKLWYQDHRVALVTGVMPNQTIGKSVYDLVNKEDLGDIACSHMKIMTDDEIPCTVFRLESLDAWSSVKYIKSRSVIVKDAWTKKNLFIVSLNQHISDEEGESLLKDQRKRVRALIAATKGLTLQEKNFDESKNMEALSMVSGNSQPESPTLSEWPSVSNCGSMQSGDSWSDNDSISGGSQPNPAQAREAQKRASLPLLKSLLIGPNYEKQTVNKLEILKCGSDTGILEQGEVSNKDSGISRSTVEVDWSTELENVSEEDTGSLPAVNVIDIDLQESLPSSGVITAPSTSGANNSAVNKKYFMTQISNFFPSVSSGGVLSDAPKQSDNAVTHHNNAKHPMVSMCSDIKSSLKRFKMSSLQLFRHKSHHPQTTHVFKDQRWN